MQVVLKRAQIVKFVTLCFILTNIIFINPITDVSASSFEIKESTADYPRLFVTKTVNQAEVTLEKSIIVFSPVSEKPRLSVLSLYIFC